MSDRYEGKPFLRLLDAYVLDAIGQLDNANATWLEQAEPHFRHIFETEGTWREIVASRMQFPDNFQAAIREVWDKGRGRFQEQSGEAPDPVQFAMTFVDKNFPH